MKREDMFGGEAIDYVASPNMSDEAVAANMAAGLGSYMYGPPQPNTIQPGYEGYSANPAYTFMQQQQQPFQQQLPQCDITYTVQPLNFGNEFLPPKGYEDTIESMQRQYMNDLMMQDVKDTVDNISREQIGIPNSYAYNGNMYNYYGNNYNYGFPMVYSYDKYIDGYRDQLQEMEEQARERRAELNMNLSKLARNYVGESFDDQQIYDMYHGKIVTIPGVSYQQIYDQQMYDNLVPFDNSQMYRDHELKVREEFNKYIKPEASMQETFDNMGIVYANWLLDEEKYKRKHLSKEVYDSSGYKALIRKSVMAKYAKEQGVVLPSYDGQYEKKQADYLTDKFAQMKRDILGEFPLLSNNSTLADDGTLHIVSTNMMESEYSDKAKRFNAFLHSANDSTGGGS